MDQPLKKRLFLQNHRVHGAKQTEPARNSHPPQFQNSEFIPHILSSNSGSVYSVYSVVKIQAPTR